MKNKRKITWAVVSMSFCVLVYLVLSVAVSGLLEAFPQYSADTLMLLMSLPSASALVGVLCFPFLLRHFTQRSISIASLLCLIAGGAICLLFEHSFPMLVVASLLMGLPHGTLAVAYPLVIKKYFTPAESTKVIALASCTMQLGSLICKVIGGYLADIHWSYVYLTYAFVVAALAVVLLGLPKEEKPQAGQKAGRSNFSVLLNRHIAILTLVAFAFPVLYFIINTHLSLYVEGYGLGTAALTGVLSAVSCAVAALVAFCFPWILKVTKRSTFEAAFLVMGLGYLLAGLHISTGSIVLAAVTGAAGSAIFTPYLISCSTIYGSGSEEAALVTSYFLMVVNVAYFASPYINNWGSRLVGDGSAGTVFWLSGAVSLLCAILFGVLKKEPLNGEQMV